MNNVNPAVTANLNTRFAALQEKHFLANDMQFFTDFKAFVEKYEWAQANKEGIRALTDAFVAAAKEKGFPLYYNNEYGVDADIFNWLPNASVAKSGAPKGTISTLEKNTAERDMLPTALKLPLSQAIERMTEELKNGYFDKKLKWLVIFLTDVRTSDGMPLLLYCNRDDDGKLSFSVSHVNPGNVWCVDDGEQAGYLSN